MKHKPAELIAIVREVLRKVDEPVAWIVAVEEHGQMVAYGPQYRSRQSAEEDARLPMLRGQKAQVWACYQVNDPTSFDPDT